MIVATEALPMNASQRLPKRLLPGQQGSSTAGPLVPNPDPSKKRKQHSKSYGNVIEEASNRKYKVQFDDGEIRVIASNILRINHKPLLLFLPVSVPPPHPLPPIGHQRGNGQEDADVAELADKESVEDELGDPNREQGGEESEEEEGQGAENTQGETSGAFVGEDLPKNYHKHL